ncbi:MAG: sigma-70 family RNA polymerase sigma factor [Candidatus Thiodiazotropha sp. 'RUGA']|nr:sigma-70 family RNA polymerase sigma factor [Candidatus Thiodiazotropha sp. 'RUGA']
MADHFSKLLIDNIPHLRRYARSLTRDPHQSDDLVQDCLDRALSRMHQWKSNTNLRAWLFTIMHNLHVSNLRGRRPSTTWESLEQSETADHKQSGQEGMIQIRDLERALSKLSDDQREILMLVCVEGMRYEEVAQVLNIATGTVMSRLHRAREALRQILRGEEPAKLRRIK